MAELAGMKRVVVKGRFEGLVMERKYAQLAKSPVPIRASIMLLNCWDWLVGDDGWWGGGESVVEVRWRLVVVRVMRKKRWREKRCGIV